MNREPMYKIGDRVKIVNYGSTLWKSTTAYFPIPDSFPVIHETKDMITYDSLPEIVGKIGIVDKATITQGVPKYGIKGIPEKYAWYHEGQMEKVTLIGRVKAWMSTL